MAVRVNLGSRFILLLAGGMGVILILSTYLHDVSTAALIEDDRYHTALGQTIELASRISELHLFASPGGLQGDIEAAANNKRAFEQIDVYQYDASGLHLAATTARDAERLPALDERAVDNDLHEMERPLPGVVTMEVVRNGVRYWLISVRKASASGFVTALVTKTGYNPLARHRAVSDNLLLAVTIAIGVGLFWLLFVRFFRRPARNIAQAMLEARDGTFTARATVDRDDELGDIAASFNAMMEDLVVRDREREALVAEIRRFNARLRDEVDRAIGELRTRSEELYQSQQKLARAERLAAMGHLAASLAHEIGTPLNAISGHLQLLARRHAGDAGTQNRIDIISEQIELIVQSVRALLRRTHKRGYVMRETDLNALVSGVLRLAGPTLEAHKITVVTELVHGLPAARADYDSLHQVLLNLINNSVDAMPTGGQLTLRTSVHPEGLSALVMVRDTGVGIRPEERDHLFEPTWTTKPTGSGFGLAIAREIIEAHGGAIHVESEPNRGATFFLRVPLAVAVVAVPTITS
jgi:signal transduction histidine kinase